jgi:hypothetical protein
MPANGRLQTHALDRAATGNNFDHGKKKKNKKTKVTQSLHRPGQTLDTGRLYPQKVFLVLIAVTGSFASRFIMKSETIMSMKSSSETTGIRTCDL